jgi:hypothetical protein
MSVIDFCDSQERMLECTAWQFNLKKTHFLSLIQKKYSLRIRLSMLDLPALHE